MKRAGRSKKPYVHFRIPPPRSIFAPPFTRAGLFLLMLGLMFLTYDAVMWLNTGRWVSLSIARIFRLDYLASHWAWMAATASLSWTALLAGLGGIVIGAALSRGE